MVFATEIGILVFQEFPNLHMVIGSLMIISSTYLLNLCKKQLFFETQSIK